jgi:hypothetical protein
VQEAEKLTPNPYFEQLGGNSFKYAPLSYAPLSVFTWTHFSLGHCGDAYQSGKK